MTTIILYGNTAGASASRPVCIRTPALAGAVFLGLALLFAACDNPAGNRNTVPVEGVSLSLKTLTLAVGGSGALTAAVSPAEASNKAVTWASGDPGVVTVDENGKVSARAAGTAAVTVTTADGGKTDTCTVTVQEEVRTITVTGVSLPETLTLGVGQEQTLTAAVSPAEATNKTVTWASGDEAVATVANGVVRGVALGTATITVTTGDGGYTAACAVTVTLIAVTGVSLPEALTVPLGGAGSLSAAVSPGGATNKAVTWASGDEAVATVTDGVVRGIALGTATITVTTEDGGHTDTCAVTVGSIADYLNSASGGASAAGPVPLALGIDLSGSGWADLLSAIKSAGKFVSLDLSDCVMAGTEFDPGTADTGESKIVSLVLPAAAASIKAGTGSDYTFRFFKALTSAGGTGILSIGDRAFIACTGLTTVSFPAATTIGNYAFQGCRALETINFPAAATIGNYAFYYCTALETVSLPAATTIDGHAFQGCSALETINFPRAATIGSYAFNYCTALETVSLPAATTIDSYVFQNCPALETVSLPAAASIGDNAFKNCPALETISLPAATSIGSYAFEDCTALETVSLPVVTSVNFGLFRGCTGLTTVNVPTATVVNEKAFQNCTALTTINLPKAARVTDNAFSGCIALTTVNLPAATSIGTYTFQSTGTQALTVTLGNTAPTVGIDNFLSVDTPKTVTVKVPSGATGYGIPFNNSDTGDNWGNAFRGKGWAGSTNAYGTGTVNTNITLDILYITP